MEPQRGVFRGEELASGFPHLLKGEAVDLCGLSPPASKAKLHKVQTFSLFIGLYFAANCDIHNELLIHFFYVAQ